MIRVLLCTPYLQKTNVVTGGINIWGNHIIKYYDSVDSNVSITPISFDRVFDVQETTGLLSRIYHGLKDYKSSINVAIKHIISGDVDLLHLFTSAQISLFKDWYILWKAKRYGVKTTIHFHFGRIPEIVAKKNWEGRMIIRICNIADGIIVMDKKSLECLCSLGYKNVFYLPNPLSMDIINQIECASQTITRIRNRILYVGHVIPTKGVYELVEACSKLNDIELHLIGTVEDKVRADLLDLASNDGVASWLKICGSIPHTEAIKEMMSSKIFILPSYTEGFPNVILESMAASCVVIATDVGAIPEMLDFDTDYACGVKLEVKSVESIKNNLSLILNDDELMKKLSKQAKKKVLDTYSMPIVWKQLEEIWINTNR